MSPRVRPRVLMSFRSSFDPLILVKYHNISNLKRKFKGSSDDWEAVLSHFLLQKQPEGDTAKWLDNVRIVYALKHDNIDITIQQDIEGIKASQTSMALMPAPRPGLKCVR